MSLDGLSFSALVAELCTKLISGRIEKIFQTDKYTLLLWIRQGNETHKTLPAGIAHSAAPYCRVIINRPRIYDPRFVFSAIRTLHGLFPVLQEIRYLDIFFLNRTGNFRLLKIHRCLRSRRSRLIQKRRSGEFRHL